MRSRAKRLTMLMVMIAAGCAGTKAPKTYTAKGKIVYTDGKPLAGGLIQFEPDKDAGASIYGEVGPDGTFSLYTLFDGQKVSGAVEGKYSVLVVPPIAASQAVQPVTLPDRYTVQPHDGNEFTITIPRPH
jgi:hypothetical protein